MTRTIRTSSGSIRPPASCRRGLMKGRQLVDGVLLSPDRVADTSWRIVGTQWRDPFECGGPGW
jgi:hypothetical protein